LECAAIGGALDYSGRVVSRSGTFEPKRRRAALAAALQIYRQRMSKSQRAYVPNSALAKSVNFNNEMMHVLLTDGRLISVPIIWFPLLRGATSEQRSNYEIGGGGTSLHWPELDEDLSIVGLMAGAESQAS
jgi:hypothetical protein